jgi:hypothetical protein
LLTKVGLVLAAPVPVQFAVEVPTLFAVDLAAPVLAPRSIAIVDSPLQDNLHNYLP